MSRDTTLITDPNSIFAVSRALRKSIIQQDPNPQNRNNAIRDEKHLAYKSTGKESFETFKYDILTNLEQLDNYFLELETVLGKITGDEDALKLQQEVRKQQTPAKRKGRPKAKTGAGYKGGALPDLPEDENVLSVLSNLLKSSSSGISDTLKKVIKAYLPLVKMELAKFQNGEIDRAELLKQLDVIFYKVRDDPELNTDDLDGTDEENALVDMDTAIQTYFESLPENVPIETEAPVSIKKRRSIPILTGNEFIVSTLSKINILLIKLIAEYNGKILVNYKKFLQSDLEEIALKVIDSQRRFRELKDYLKDYEQGTKAVNITKFLSTIDQNFQKFTALSSRSIANFVNPNIQFLPNFSQQLSGTFQDPKQPFNLYQATEVQKSVDFDTKVDKLVTKYNEYDEAYIEERDNTFIPLRDRLDDTETRIEEYNAMAKLTAAQKIALETLKTNKERIRKKLDKSITKLNQYEDKMEKIKAMPEYAFFPRGVV